MVYTIAYHATVDTKPTTVFFNRVLLDAGRTRKDADVARGERCEGKASGAVRFTLDRHRHHGRENEGRAG